MKKRHCTDHIKTISGPQIKSTLYGWLDGLNCIKHYMILCTQIHKKWSV